MLNRAQKLRTAEELRGNLEIAGLTPVEVCHDLGMTVDRFDATLAVKSADPVDVWELRDYLERAVVDAGRVPVPFTVLTEESRRSANGWFRLRTAPRRSSIS